MVGYLVILVIAGPGVATSQFLYGLVNDYVSFIDKHLGKPASTSGMLVILCLKF